MSKSNIDPAEKLRTVHQILDGKETQHHAASRLEISWTSIQQWISIYQSEGEGAFLVTRNKRYSKERYRIISAAEAPNRQFVNVMEFDRKASYKTG